METENQKLRARVEELSRETMLLAHTVTDLTAKLKLATSTAPQPVDAAQAVPEGLSFDGYHDSDEHYGKTILDLVRSRLETDPDDLAEGAVFYVNACWVQPQEWRVVRAGNPTEVERIAPVAQPTDTTKGA